MPAPIVAAVKQQDLAALKRALRGHDAPLPAQAVVEAGRLAWLPGLELLVEHGADLDASYRHYRPLHALIQEKPHEGGSSTPARVACLEWMLGRGADPEKLAAWPAARALVIAAFVGEPSYVRVLRHQGGRVDVFTAAALGDAKRVRGYLSKDSSLATARDGGLLTALQCCGGSRMGAHDAATAQGLLDCARVLSDAGADPNATTPSWGHDIAVSYFVIRSRQVEVLKLLLERGLDPTAAVATAAWDSQEEILDLLLAHGAQLDRAFEHDRPVLNDLIRWGQFSAARLLLARGASPNVADARGWTALHQAASRGNARIVDELLARGADGSRVDHEGRRPRDIARGKTLDRLGRKVSAASAGRGSRRAT